MREGSSKNLFLLGFLAFMGFKGVNDDPLYFIYFAFGGYFSQYWWYKLSHLKKQAPKSHRYRAGSISFGICFTLAFALIVLLKQFSFDMQSSFKLLLLVLSFAFAISMNLWAFLTYRFDLGK